MNDLDFYSFLEFLFISAGLVGNIVVANVCLKAYQKFRNNAFLLLAVSAFLAIFAGFSDILILQKLESGGTRDFLWSCIMILYIIDVILYAIGVSKLVAWITSKESDGQIGAEEPADVSK